MTAAEGREYPDVYAPFASRVRTLRTSHGWSVRGLADAAGIAPSTLSRIENGLHKASLEHAVRLAAALGVPLGDLAAPDGCARCAGRPPLGFICGTCFTAGVPR